MTSRQTACLLITIVLIGTALRVYHLTDRSLWFDEAFSWRLIQFPLPELLTRAAADVHPPLYYLLLKAWASLGGSSLLSLRLFSVAAAAAATMAAYLFTAYATSSRRTALLAAGLFAMSPWQIQFAWEARMYTLGCALALASSWLLLKAIRQERLGWWIAYAFGSAAFAYVHYFAFFTLAAHAVFLIMGQRRQFKRVLLAGGIIFALYLPWLPTLITQNAQVQESFWIPPLEIRSMPDTFYRMFVPAPGALRHASLSWRIVAGLPFVATLALWLYLAFGQKIRAPYDGRGLVVLSAVVPFLLAIATSLVGQSLYQDRFFVFTHIFIIIGLAMVLASIKNRPLRYAAWLALLLSFFLSFVQLWRELDIPKKGGSHAVMAFIAERYRGQEPIIVSSPFIFFAVSHYIEEEYSALSSPRLYSPSGELAHFAGGPIIRPAEVIDQAFIDQASLNSLWVVDTTGFGEKKLELNSQWQADASAAYAEVFSYQGLVSATHYRRHP